MSCDADAASDVLTALLEKERTRLVDLEDELGELKREQPQEMCSHCRQPQRDWQTLLRHYGECLAIKRARELTR